MNKRKDPNRLLAFFSKKYYGAYEKMIDELRPLLATPNQSSWLLERLDFRPDLQRGERKLIYYAIGQLLKSGSHVLVKGYCKNDLFRWLSDSRHCNLGISFQTIKSAVNKTIGLGV